MSGRVRGGVVRFGLTTTGRAAPEDAIAVLGVHGRTQSPAFMQEIARRLGDDRLAWFAPAAPDNTWYPSGFQAPVQDNQPFLDESLADLAGTLQLMSEEGWSSDRTVLLGFSQGACLLSQFLLSAPQPQSAAAVLFTGGFVGPEGAAPPSGTDWVGLPVFCGLVEEDPWVPLGRARATADVLRHRGADVELRVYPGNVHEVNDDELSAVRALLARLRA